MPNKIELYGVIGSEWDGVTARGLVRELSRIARDEADKSVDLHVNSGGGFVDDAVAMYNRLRQHSQTHDAPINVYIDALAASAATIVVLAGTTVTMPANATLMIHQPWGLGIGTANDMRDAADLLDMTESQMVAMYVAATGLDEAQVRQMLADETWMTADEAKAFGFVDVVTADGANVTQARARAVSQYVDARVTEPSKLPDYRRAPAWARIAPTSEPARARAQQEPEQEQQMSTKNTTTEPAALPAIVTTEPAAPAAPAAPTQPVAVDPAALIQAERKRSSAIMALCEQHNVPAELRTKLLNDGTMELQASAKILEHLASNQPSRSGISVDVDESENRAKGVQRALELRAGLLTPTEAKAERGQNRYASFSLSEMAMAFAEDRKGSRMEVLGRVLAAVPAPDWGRSGRPSADIGITHSTSDFTSILADVANKSMLFGWDQVPQTHEPWTNKGVLNDFRATKRVGLNLFPALLEVEEGAEYQGATMGDRGMTMQLATYGRIFAITRQALINDDLMAFTEVPRKMGQAAARTVGNAVYAILTTNAALDDSIALFHADHANTAAITNIDAAGLQSMKALMRTQTSPDGHVLSIQPAHLIVPATQELDGQQLLHAAYLGGGDTNVQANTLNLIVEPRLDANSTDICYLAADGNQFDTVEVAYLDGNNRPYLEQQQGYTVDGTSFKVRLDFGVGVRDYRGLVSGT